MSAPGRTSCALVVGDNCLDCYAGEVEAYYPGGNAVNVAVYLQRQGIATSYHGYVGDDAGGRYLLAALEEEGVDLSLVEVLPGATGRTFVEVREGERVFVGDDPGVQVPFRANLARLQASACHLAHFSGFTSWGGGAEQCEPDLAGELRALASRALLSVDFSDGKAGEKLFAEVGSLLTYGFFSRPELDDAEAAGFIAGRCQHTRGTVVLTRGSQGSAAGQGGGPVCFHPPPRAQLVDTLGAGDAFIAGFLSESLRSAPLPAALAAGTSVAGQVIGEYGAWTNAVVDRLSRSLSEVRGRVLGRAEKTG